MTRKEGQKERRLSYIFLNEATNIFNLLGWVAHPWNLSFLSFSPPTYPSPPPPSFPSSSESLSSLCLRRNQAGEGKGGVCLWRKEGIPARKQPASPPPPLQPGEEAVCSVLPLLLRPTNQRTSQPRDGERGGRGGRPSIRGTNKISGQEHFKRFMGEGEGRGTLPPAREKREEGAARAARKYIFCCLFPPFFAPPPPTIFFPPLVQYIHMPNDQRRRGKKRR